MILETPFPHNNLPIWTVSKKLVTKVASFELLSAKNFIPRSVSSNYYPFRILFKCGSNQSIIAWDATEKDIMVDWLWIEQHIVDVLNELENSTDAQEFLDVKLRGFVEQNQNQGSNTSSKNAPPSPSETTINSEKPPSCSAQDWEDFKNHFPEVYAKHQLIAVYSCLLWNKIPVKGTLFITVNSVSFEGFQVKPVTVQFGEIKTIEKPGSSGRMRALTIVTKADKRHWISSISEVDQMYGILQELWDRSMKQKLLTAEQNHAEIQYQHSMAAARKMSSSPESTPAPERNPLRPSSDLIDPRKQNLEAVRKARNFQILFRLPFDEIITKEFKCKLHKKYEKNNRHEDRRGKLYLSPHFISFESESYGKGKKFTLVIPFTEIKDITQEVIFSDHNSKVPAVCIYTSGIPFTLLSKTPEEVFSNLRKILKESEHELKIYYNSSVVHSMRFDPRLPPNLIEDTKQFPPNFQRLDEQRELEWTPYLLPYAGGVMYRTPRLRQLVRKGVPNRYRGHIWLLTSGAYAYMMRFKKGYYKTKLEEALQNPTNINEDIEKDLHRSFPEHPYYQSQEGLDALRRTLLAFSHHNPSVGYCQSMNIVSAFLLLFLSEEQTFFMLCVLCDHLIPDYYVPAMIGSIVDERIFKNILEEKMPAVLQHMSSVSLPTTMVALPWFLCIFIGYAPLETSMRICDVFFFEGPRALFCLSYAVLKIYEPVILSTNDAPTISTKMKLIQYNWDDIFQLAFSELDSFPAEKITNLRNIHRFNVIKEMEEKNKNSLLRDWKRNTKFSEQELLQMHEKIMSVTTGYLLNAIEFQTIFSFWVPWFRFGAAGPMDVFRMLDITSSGFAELNQVVRVLSVLLKGSTQDHIKISFEIMDGDRDGLLSQEEFSSSLEILAKLTSHARENSTLLDENDPLWSQYLQTNRPRFDQEAVATAFMLADDQGRGRIDLEQFKNALEMPLISMALLLDQ